MFTCPGGLESASGPTRYDAGFSDRRPLALYIQGNGPRHHRVDGVHWPLEAPAPTDLCLGALRNQYGNERVSQVRSRIGFGEQDLKVPAVTTDDNIARDACPPRWILPRSSNTRQTRRRISPKSRARKTSSGRWRLRRQVAIICSYCGRLTLHRWTAVALDRGTNEII